METKKKVFLMLVEDCCDILWWAGDSLESVVACYENGCLFLKGKDYILEEVNPELFSTITVRCAERSLAGEEANFLLSDYIELLTATNFFDSHNSSCLLPCYTKD